MKTAQSADLQGYYLLDESEADGLRGATRKADMRHARDDSYNCNYQALF